jgi:hypothetical protein
MDLVRDMFRRPIALRRPRLLDRMCLTPAAEEDEDGCDAADGIVAGKVESVLLKVAAVAEVFVGFVAVAAAEAVNDDAGVPIGLLRTSFRIRSAAAARRPFPPLLVRGGAARVRGVFRIEEEFSSSVIVVVDVAWLSGSIV